MLATRIKGSDSVDFQRNYNQRGKKSLTINRKLSGSVIRLLTMFMFAVVMLESSHGFISARLDVSQLSYAMALIHQQHLPLLPKAVEEDNLIVVASNDFIPSGEVEAEQKGSSLDRNAPTNTAVLSYSETRSALSSKHKEADIMLQKLSRARLVKHFGQHFDLGSSKYSRYDHLFQKYTKKYFDSNTDWRWFKVQAFVESGMQNSGSSRVGAIGIMQIMPATFKDIAKVNRFFRGKSIKEVEWNIAAGIFYNRLLIRALSKQAAPKKRLQLMFASYNAGLNRVLRLMDEDQLDINRLLTVPGSFPRETRDYLKKIDVLMTSYRGVSYSESLDNLAKLKQPIRTEGAPRS